MTFPEALALIFNSSARITRRTWNSPATYCSVVNDRLTITGGIPADGKDPHLPHPWEITSEDYFADDWEIVE